MLCPFWIKHACTLETADPFCPYLTGVKEAALHDAACTKPAGIDDHKIVANTTPSVSALDLFIIILTFLLQRHKIFRTLKVDFFEILNLAMVFARQ